MVNTLVNALKNVYYNDKDVCEQLDNLTLDKANTDVIKSAIRTAHNVAQLRYSRNRHNSFWVRSDGTRCELYTCVENSPQEARRRDKKQIIREKKLVFFKNRREK